MSAGRRAPRELSGALGRLTRELAPATTLARVQGVWERSTGPKIAAAAAPVAERNGVLTVSCSTAAWAHELELMSGELIGRLNGALGDGVLTGMRCRVGSSRRTELPPRGRA